MMFKEECSHNSHVGDHSTHRLASVLGTPVTLLSVLVGEIEVTQWRFHIWHDYGVHKKSVSSHSAVPSMPPPWWPVQSNNPGLKRVTLMGLSAGTERVAESVQAAQVSSTASAITPEGEWKMPNCEQLGCWRTTINLHRCESDLNIPSGPSSSAFAMETWRTICLSGLQAKPHETQWTFGWWRYLDTEHTLIRDNTHPGERPQAGKASSSSSWIVLEVTEVKLKRGLAVIIITYV